MTLLLVYLFVAMAFSFICSIMEAVLLSITPSYVSIKLSEGGSTSRDLESMKNNIDRPLAAILTLNTFANTMGAAGVGAQAQDLWGDEFLSIASALLTVLILIFSEIIPKTLGANHWKLLAPWTVKVLKILIYSPLFPFVILAQFITSKLKKEKGTSVLSRAEFSALAEMVGKHGVLMKDETLIMKNLLMFNTFRTRQIMTPRTVLMAAPEKQTIQEFYKEKQRLNFSRVPVFAADVDHITGYFLKDDLLEHLIQGQGEQPLATLRRPIRVTIESLPVAALFRELIESQEHIALVVDEHGGTEGIVTMEDIVETLLGLEIVDEFDSVEDMQVLAKKVWENRKKLFETKR